MAMMGLGGFSCDRQADACAGNEVFGVGAAIKALEDALSIFKANWRPLIVDRDDDLRMMAFRGDPDRRSCRRIFRRVVDELANDCGQ